MKEMSIGFRDYQRRFKNLRNIHKEGNKEGVTASKTSTFRHIWDIGATVGFLGSNIFTA